MGLRVIRDHAASLYRVFANDKYWKCQCKSQHVTSLRLESRRKVLEEDSSTADSPSRFRILLSTTHPSKALPGMFHWQEIETLSSSCAKHETASTANIIASAHVVGLTVAASTVNSTLASCQPPESTVSPIAAIANLCNIVWMETHSTEMIGFLSDEGNHEHNHKHYLYRVDTLPANESQSRSLHEVLCETRTTSPLGSLLKRERLELAITLAYGVLLLDGTSWLSSQWSSHDINFHGKLGEDPTPLTNPYLSWRQCAVDEDFSLSTRTLTISDHMIRNRNLFTLGLILIELCFGKPFSALHSPEDKKSDNTDAACAFRLLAFVDDEMDGVYGDVVRRCLFRPFDVRSMSLDIEDVQQRVYSEIVVPLIENLMISQGPSTKSLSMTPS